MIKSTLTQARLLYQQQNYDDALVILDRYAAHDELTVEMLLLKGRLIQLSESGKFDLSDAKESFLKALEQDAECTKAMLELGWLALNVLDEPVEARQYFTRALTLINATRDEALNGLEKCENSNIH